MPKTLNTSQDHKDKLNDLFKISEYKFFIYLDALKFEEKYALLIYLYPDLKVDKNYFMLRPGVIDMKIYDKYLI